MPRRSPSVARTFGSSGRPRLLPALVLALAPATAMLSLAAPADASGSWSPPGPSLPDPPPGSTCLLIQRGTLGEAWDSDVAPTNGNWAPGAYPLTWTGLSQSNHWSLYKFDMSAVPAGAQVVLGAFTTYVGWNDQASTVRLHRVLVPWTELTVTWESFGGAASWDPAVIATFNPSGVGHKTVDVTGLVQAWYSGAVPNHGLLMEEDPVKLHGYYASESSTAVYRPSLYVCYVAGGPCAGLGEGSACDDGNLCTTGESCVSGQCVGGQPLSCTPLDDCHETGVCDPTTGLCTTPEKQDGAACNDADLCTTGDACLSGMCVGAEPVSCFDGSACTAEVCDPAVGCVSSTISCDDGNACTTDGCDAGSGCTHTAVVCDDGDACTADTCNPASGCAIAPVSCDDGNACTTDGCDAQTGCLHAALSCNDGEVCTTDSCDPAVGCTTAPVACDDAVACTADSCAPGSGCEHVVACPPGAPCAANLCNSPAGQTEVYSWFCN